MYLLASTKDPGSIGSGEARSMSASSALSPAKKAVFSKEEPRKDDEAVSIDDSSLFSSPRRELVCFQP
jgi:hypothetical protein